MALEVELRWSATHEDDADFVGCLVRDTETLLNAWAGLGVNAEAAVEKAVAMYFGSSDWDEAFGIEADSVTVLVEVHSPPEVAGKYRVDLERVTKGNAKRLEAA